MRPRFDLEYRYEIDGEVILDLPDGIDPDGAVLFAHFDGDIPKGTAVVIQHRINGAEWKPGIRLVL